MRSLVVAGTVVAALAGCGATQQDGAAAPSCAATVDATLRTVAMRVYAQAAAGPNVVAATRRLARSRALSRAVARGNAAATRAALRPLLRSQIHRIVVTRGPRVLARVGSAPALAPVHGVIRDATGRPVGRYTLAVGDEKAIARIVHALTGARVSVLAAGDPAPPRSRAAT